MRLADILAAELDHWADTTACYVQDQTRVVFPAVCVPLVDDCAVGMWDLETKVDFNDDAAIVYSEVLATDSATAIVVRWEWEAARARQAQP